jgi:hypothetical protein
MHSSFDDNEILLIDELFTDSREITEIPKNNILDVRRRLEKMLDEKRLKHELDDFVDWIV